MPSPTNPQNLNRFSYVLNNPVRYADPTGHKPCEEYAGTCLSENQVTQIWNNPQNNHHHHDNDDDNDGGGDKPLAMPDPIPAEEDTNNYYCLTYSFSCGVGAVALSIPFLPPSPFACGWVDCALSAVSILASGKAGATEYGVPEIAAVAVGVDFVVTAVAFVHTVNDYHQGKISVEREWILNGTGVLGVIPIGPFGAFGLGFSIINGMATFSGYPP